MVAIITPGRGLYINMGAGQFYIPVHRRTCFWHVSLHQCGSGRPGCNSSNVVKTLINQTYFNKVILDGMMGGKVDGCYQTKSIEHGKYTHYTIYHIVQ